MGLKEEIEKSNGLLERLITITNKTRRTLTCVNIINVITLIVIVYLLVIR
ncbi:hypothetical protein LCGC14_1164990 [marine sediment metagenome]|uniref:Uncharacterized protein n=1 Tax=marine sediment metagenome TaxID=412755 RepID=A0A0F9P9P5_9ZZZZ